VMHETCDAVTNGMHVVFRWEGDDRSGLGYTETSEGRSAARRKEFQASPSGPSPPVWRDDVLDGGARAGWSRARRRGGRSSSRGVSRGVLTPGLTFSANEAA
jgi:hypothetical protein